MTDNAQLDSQLSQMINEFNKQNNVINSETHLLLTRVIIIEVEYL